MTIGDGLTSIGRAAFEYCDALTEVIIGDGVTSIGDRAFGGCYALDKVNIKDLSSWCKIEFNSNPLRSGAKLYLNDKEITQLVIPEDISVIKDNAFAGCESITSVTIHDGVTSIGGEAFWGCPINVLYCYATKPPTLDNSFSSWVVTGETLYVPARCGAAYKSSKWGNYFMNIVEMD